MGHIGMCGPNSAILVINRVSLILAILVINRVSLILAILVINRVGFLHSCLELDMFFRRSYFFHHYQ